MLNPNGLEKTNECDRTEKKILFWKRIFYFVCIPAIIAGAVNAFGIKHKTPRPPFKEYRYLRIRRKNFPWGDGEKTLFHNPKTNALPTGYETEEEEED